MAKYNADQMKTMMAKGQAMANASGQPSFPIMDREDLANAIRAVGRAGRSGDAVRRFIMKRARALGLSDMIPDTWNSDGSLNRSEPVANEWNRDYPLADIRILTRSQGSEYADGRTVEALVAVWDRPARIVDRQGEYIETIGRTAFDKVISDLRPQGSRTSWPVGVFYNHAMTLHGTPSERGSVPIGSALDIRADTAGLVTVTRYNNTSLAEDILETIRSGDVTGHSFSGRIIKSNPARPPRRGYAPDPKTGELTRVHRLELGLREYGPTPAPAYAETAILSVRSLPTTQHFLDEEAVEPDTLDDSGAVTDEPLAEHSSRDATRSAVARKVAALRLTRPELWSESERS